MKSLDNHSKRIIANYIPKSSFLNYHIASNKRTNIIGWFNQPSIHPPFEDHQLFPFKTLNDRHYHRRILGTLILKPNVYIKNLSPYLKTMIFQNRQIIIVNEDYGLKDFDFSLIDFAIHHWNRDILTLLNRNFNKIPKIIFDIEHNKSVDQWTISHMLAEFIILPPNIPTINTRGAYNENLKTLIFPHDSITYEIKNSFNYLKSLTNLILPPNIKLISNSFNGCQLNNLKIPKNCQIIVNSFNRTTLNGEKYGIIIDSFEPKISQY